MRSYARTIIVLALAAGLLALFLRNVDLGRVFADILHARPEWLVLSLSTAFLNLVIRALRWQFLLEPLGSTAFGNVFRATAVGFAATSLLPARAGEVIRPYFLARHEQMSATGAFATIIVERLLDTITVLILLASYVFVFGRDVAFTNPLGFKAIKWAGGSAKLPASVLLGKPLTRCFQLATMPLFTPAARAPRITRERTVSGADYRPEDTCRRRVVGGHCPSKGLDRGRCPFRTSGQPLEPEDAAVYLRQTQSHPHHRPA